MSKAKKYTHPQQMKIMRVALDLLKEKFMESEGAWSLVDFMGAATDDSHWMHKVVLAEELSKPFLKVKV